MATHSGSDLKVTFSKDKAGDECFTLIGKLPKGKGGKAAAVTSASGKMDMLCSLGWTQYGEINGAYKGQPLKATMMLGVKAKAK